MTLQNSPGNKYNYNRSAHFCAKHVVCAMWFRTEDKANSVAPNMWASASRRPHPTFKIRFSIPLKVHMIQINISFAQICAWTPTYVQAHLMSNDFRSCVGVEGPEAWRCDSLKCIKLIEHLSWSMKGGQQIRHICKERFFHLCKTIYLMFSNYIYQPLLTAYPFS